jgi:tRNA wybutosine-synthesizing protein 1
MPKHIAISLDGEPTLYPYLPKLIELASEQGMTTFLVTNGTIPAAIEALTTEPTNLYISLYGPDRETYEAVAGAGAGNLWENVLRSLRLLAKFRCRTVIRLTLTKGLNMLKPDLYGELISTSEAKYIEVKGYAWLGQSRRRLPKAAAPSFEEVKEFAVKLSDTTRYRLRGEDRPGRVILLSR